MILAADPDTDTAAGLAFILGIGALVALIIVVLVWQGAAIYRARAVAAQQAGYRDLATRAVAAQEQLAASQQQTEARLQELAGRFAALEKILKDVE
jgi:hypothetical protein